MTYGKSHWLENATKAVTMVTTWFNKIVRKKAKEEEWRRRRNELEKVQKRRSEGRNKAQREAILTAIVRKPCKDCGPISAPPCVREFISSLLSTSSFVRLLLPATIFTVAMVQWHLWSHLICRDVGDNYRIHKVSFTIHLEKMLWRKEHPIYPININNNFLYKLF